MFDLQVNGFKKDNISCNFWDNPSCHQIELLSEYLYKEGIKNYLATLITSSFEELKINLGAINCCSSRDRNLFGVHIEGGLISRLGVHPAEYARELDLAKVKELVAEFPGLIKLWTLCPSLDKNGDITKFLQDSGIKVSFGHSQADYETAWNAFENFGVDLVTHWGNAMLVTEGFRQRACRDEDLAALDEASEENSGIGLAAYRHPKVNLMLISGSDKDGDLHLDPKLLKKVFSKKPGQVILVSDMVHYDGLEKPEKLVGGLASLKQHRENALELGIEESSLIDASQTLPERLFAS